jgi:hypothetical protein
LFTQIDHPFVQNGRLHLALLSEGFRDILTSPTTHADATDADAFVLGKMSQICNAVHKLMPGVLCTATELAHYQVIGLLSGLVPLGASLIASSTHTADFTALAGAADLALVNMRKTIPSQEDSFLSDVTILASLHGVSMYRESAASVRLAAKWLLDLNDREQQRSGKTVAAAALKLLNGLHTGAKRAIMEARDLVKLNHLKHADFEDKFKGWMSAADEMDEATAAMADLVSSWRANAKGWEKVQWHVDDIQS